MIKELKNSCVVIFCCLVTWGMNAQSEKDAVKADWNTLIVGKWVNKINRTLDGKVYNGLKCRGTIQYLSNGTYSSKQCVWNETGKWRFSDNKDAIIHFEIDNAYWKKELGTEDLGESHAQIISLSETEFVTVLFDEELGEVHQYYVRRD